MRPSTARGGLLSQSRVLVLGLAVCMALMALNAWTCMGRRGVRESGLHEKIRALEEERSRFQEELAKLRLELEQCQAQKAERQSGGGQQDTTRAHERPPAEQASGPLPTGGADASPEAEPPAEQGSGALPTGGAEGSPAEILRVMLQDPSFEGKKPSACQLPSSDQMSAVYACNEERRKLRRDRVGMDCAAEKEGVWCLNASDPKIYNIALAPDLTPVDIKESPWFWATDPSWRQPWKLFGGHVPPDIGMGPELLRIYGRESSVVDFGAGVGQYGWFLKGIGGGGGVRYYEAYDGAGNVEAITRGAVKSLLLTIPQYLRRRFDWVQCLEVGEHIPPQTTEVFVGNLVRHAKRGIVLSWAVPRQRGTGHVNHRTNEAVIEIMRERGFEHNANVSQALRDAAQRGWFKQSLMVFDRRGSNVQ